MLRAFSLNGSKWFTHCLCIASKYTQRFFRYTFALNLGTFPTNVADMTFQSGFPKRLKFMISVGKRFIAALR